VIVPGPKSLCGPCATRGLQESVANVCISFLPFVLRNVSASFLVPKLASVDETLFLPRRLNPNKWDVRAALSSSAYGEPTDCGGPFPASLQKRLKIYLRARVAPEAIRWAIRLSQTTAGFCNECLGYCLQNMERGLKQGREVRSIQWGFVDIWKLRQGRPSKTNLTSASLRRTMAFQQNEYQLALRKLEEFERAFLAGVANLKVVFRVQEGVGVKAKIGRRRFGGWHGILTLSPTNLRTG
jgi:hypothetical protein